LTFFASFDIIYSRITTKGDFMTQQQIITLISGIIVFGGGFSFVVYALVTEYKRAVKNIK
jgi:hypothetical protein